MHAASVRAVQTHDWLVKYQPITRRQKFRLIQIETNCKRNFQAHLKWKIIRVENIVKQGEIACYHPILHFDTLKIYSCVENSVRKGKITCYKQFHLFS